MKKIIFYSILFGLLFVVLYVFNSKYILNKYQPKKLKVLFEVVTVENDIFQLYYREASGKLSERLSEKVKVIASEKPQILQFDIPDTLKVSHFRFDFGNSERETDVKINKIIFTYNGNKEIINREVISELFKANRYTEQHANGFTRKIINGRSSPFLLSIDLEKLINCLKERPNKNRLIINILLSTILSFSICIAIFLHAKNIKLRGKDDIVFISAFMLILLMPHLDELFNLDNTAITEKRELKKKPEITFENYDEYPENFETYYNDNFGFRKKMVSLGAMLRIKLFHSIPNSNNVIVGKDNWLFYWKSEIIKNSYLNKNPFSSDSLGKFGQSFLEMKQFANQNEKLFLSTVYPNKHTIYEDKIPTRIRNIKKENIKRIDQFYIFLNNNNIPNCDHRETLLKQKKNDQLYLKNDSHWNAKGAYYAYYNIINLISKEDRSISPPLGIDVFHLQKLQNYLGGDLLPILGIDNSMGLFNDNYIRYRPSRNHFKKSKDIYGKGNLLIENLECENEKTAVFFGDSYSKELLNFLPLHFRNTIFIPNIRLDMKQVKAIDPDIIVYGIVERNLENFE
tara:strand:+ start:10008 stop:11717 length:1710 start_codon:yes stop_codon:yes gene_type:complete